MDDRVRCCIDGRPAQLQDQPAQTEEPPFVVNRSQDEVRSCARPGIFPNPLFSLLREMKKEDPIVSYGQGWAVNRSSDSKQNGEPDSTPPSIAPFRSHWTFWGRTVECSIGAVRPTWSMDIERAVTDGRFAFTGDAAGDSLRLRPGLILTNV